MSSRRAGVWRGDVLRLMQALDDPEQQRQAVALAGFTWPPPAPAPQPALAVPEQIPVRYEPPPLAVTDHLPGPQVPLRTRVFTFIPPEPLAEPDVAAPAAPAPLPEAAPADFRYLLTPNPAIQGPPRLALTPDVRMGAFLRQHLRPPRLTQNLDTTRWVAELARGSLPRQLPRRQRLAWGQASGVFIHGGSPLEPLLADAHALMQRLRHEAGPAVHVAWWVDDEGWYVPQGEQWVLRKARHLPAVARALLVNAAPQASLSEWHRLGWRRLWRLAQQPGAVTALCPWGASSSVRHDTSATTKPLPWPGALRWVAWEHGRPLGAGRPAMPRVPADTLALGVERLLSFFTLAVRVEPDLLRAMRLRLGLPAQVEQLVWRHPAVGDYALAVQFHPDRLPAYRQALRQEPLGLRQAVAGLVQTHHVMLSPFIQLEEAALAAELADLPEEPRAGLRWSDVAQLMQAQPDDAGAQAAARYVGRAQGRVGPGVWQASPGLAHTWVLAQQESLLSGTAQVPAGLPAAWVAQWLGTSGAQDGLTLNQPWWLVLRPDGFWLEPEALRQGKGGHYDAWPLPGDVVRASGLVVQVGDELPVWIAAGVAQPHHLCPMLPDAQGWRVRIGPQTVGVREVIRPSWATGLGCDRQGVQVSFQTPWGQEDMLPWTGKAYEGSDGLGTDRFGLYWEFKLPKKQGGVQRFRWIEPGSFLMGSPETEAERDSDEGPQHRVTLTQGFWLADTVCTQALWLAVVGGENPSYFNGNDELPVEQVSWDDVMKVFMPKLQALLPKGLEATLPSEAQWEYACRAGTSTAYVWGDEVTPQMANIDTGQTTPVKTYPANPWGLFDMHGNVFEWCFDELRTYAAKAAVDPSGAAGNGLRVLRGGSWLNLARHANSTFRDLRKRSSRGDSFGFRVALRFKPNQGVEHPGIGTGGSEVQRSEISLAEPVVLSSSGTTAQKDRAFKLRLKEWVLVS